MTWVSVALIAFGVADLSRAKDSRASRWLPSLAGGATLVVIVALTDMIRWADVFACLVVLLALVAWVRTSTHTQRTGRGAGVPLAITAVLLAGLTAASGFASAPAGLLSDWLTWADLPDGLAQVPVGRLLLLTGLVLFNLATGNVIVRLVLLAIGALRPDRPSGGHGSSGHPQPADRLKGGRLLGPMERLVILGLGLAGELGAASIVIAAKGLLRFPEIQAVALRSPPDPAGSSPGPSGGAPGLSSGAPGLSSGAPGPLRAGIDDVTEYFLVGSFVNWLVALGSLAPRALTWARAWRERGIVADQHGLAWAMLPAAGARRPAVGQWPGGQPGPCHHVGH